MSSYDTIITALKKLLLTTRAEVAEFCVLTKLIKNLFVALKENKPHEPIMLEIKLSFAKCWHLCIVLALIILSLICRANSTNSNEASVIANNTPQQVSYNDNKYEWWEIASQQRFKGKDADGIADEMLKIAIEDEGQGEYISTYPAFGRIKLTIDKVYAVRNTALAFDKLSSNACVVYPNPTFIPGAASNKIGCTYTDKIVVYHDTALDWEFNKTAYMFFIGSKAFETESGEVVRLNCFTDLRNPYKEAYLSKVKNYNDVLMEQRRLRREQEAAARASIPETPKKWSELTLEEKEARIRKEWEEEAARARKKHGIKESSPKGTFLPKY